MSHAPVAWRKAAAEVVPPTSVSTCNRPRQAEVHQAPVLRCRSHGLQGASLVNSGRKDCRDRHAGCGRRRIQDQTERCGDDQQESWREGKAMGHG